jgi:hypothetical protein
MSEAETDDSSTGIAAMSEDFEPPLETHAPEFATAWIQYAALVVLIVAILAYGGSLLWPRLFKSSAPTTDTPVASEPAPAVVPPPQPRCRHGFGDCDWAGLHSPQPHCHNGVGACDWAKLHSPPRCQNGGAGCDSAALQPAQPRCRYGVGACDWGRK